MTRRGAERQGSGGCSWGPTPRGRQGWRGTEEQRAEVDEAQGRGGGLPQALRSFASFQSCPPVPAAAAAAAGAESSSSSSSSVSGGCPGPRAWQSL